MLRITPLRRFITLAAFTLAATPAVLGAQAAPPSTSAGQQFTIMIWETPAQLALRTDGTRGEAYWNAFASYGEVLQKAGILRGGTALRTGNTVRTVTVRGGNERVASGAFVRKQNDIGGYFIIEVASLDDAVRWAAKVPSALTGAVEVRAAYPAPTMMK